MPNHPSLPGSPASSEAQVPVQWRLRAEPLPATGVAARGDAAAALARRLLARDDEALSRLAGVCAPGLLVLLGDEEALPWADGAVYLGRDPECPSLLLPTTHQPDVPLPLLERALLARFPELVPPLAVVPALGCVAALGPARTLARAALLSWLEGGS